ncbi:RNA polymerase sigma factor [Luteimicrobium sp. DT211]|uniref:RNA polymerase sigma factor n=1 Tax=Luteimicrobium sp. DT211 TaxID=3393412 RepID=UPI003CF17BC3
MSTVPGGSAHAPGTPDDDARAAVVRAHRDEWATVLAATARTARDLDLAEECVQEAYASALTGWPRDGVPRNPAAWLTTVARRRALDVIRREQAFRVRMPLLVEVPDGVDPAELATADPADPWASGEPDDLLRLVFLCCHPALAQEAQLALTLRLVCGLATPDVARTLLVSETTMAARITRAKKKIATARIPFRTPRAAELPERLPAVLGVVHLLFTAGHTAPSGPELVRGDAADRALRLARTLRRLMPDEPEVGGLLALILATDARRATRVDDDGHLVRLEDQDRSRWDRDALAEADVLVVAALRSGRAGRYVLQAAIASLYADAPTYAKTDWPQLVTLYDRLLELWPSPVVALNRTVPLAGARGPAAALAEVETLAADPRLERYPYLPAVRADLLRRLDRPDDAAAAYREALALTANDAERAFLAERLAGLAAVGVER